MRSIQPAAAQRRAAARAGPVRSPRTGPAPAAPEPRRIQSIEVGFRLIRALEASDAPLALKDVAARAGMAPSKALLYLASFTALGMVARDAAGQYALGPYAIALGLAALGRTGIAEAAAEPLAALAARTRQAAYVSVWGNRGPTVLLKADGEARVPMSIRVGHVLPLEDSATGAVFLAHLPEALTRPLLGAGGARARQSLAAAVRRDGVAASSGRVNSGFAALAAPVFDHEGGLAGSVTLLGPESRIDTHPTHATAARLRETAEEISRRLGRRVPAPARARGAASAPTAGDRRR